MNPGAPTIISASAAPAALTEEERKKAEEIQKQLDELAAKEEMLAKEQDKFDKLKELNPKAETSKNLEALKKEVQDKRERLRDGVKTAFKPTAGGASDVNRVMAIFHAILELAEEDPNIIDKFFMTLVGKQDWERWEAQRALNQEENYANRQQFGKSVPGRVLGALGSGAAGAAGLVERGAQSVFGKTAGSVLAAPIAVPGKLVGHAANYATGVKEHLVAAENYSKLGSLIGEWIGFSKKSPAPPAPTPGRSGP